MRNEESVNYTVADTTKDQAPRITGARVKLVGTEEPSASITNSRELEKYCKNLLDGCAYEEFHVICVDAQCRVLCDSCISLGTLSSVNAYVRNIATVALLSNAHSVFLTHNHPGGTCRPSAEDVSSTVIIKKALAMFEISVLDHMIVTNTGSYSMMQQGDF